MIHYANGKLSFTCETEGVQFNSLIKDSDIASYMSSEIELGVTYDVSVYAHKDGYEGSEGAFATFCWIDVEPQKEGITERGG